MLYALAKLLCLIKIFASLSNYVCLGSHPNIQYPILKKSDFGERSNERICGYLTPWVTLVWDGLMCIN